MKMMLTEIEIFIIISIKNKIGRRYGERAYKATEEVNLSGFCKAEMDPYWTSLWRDQKLAPKEQNQSVRLAKTLR